jgi:hypothetical protein
MEKLFIFGLLSLVAIFFSWRTLFTVKSHGFYRFFSWECTFWLFSVNYPFWFYNPFSLNQIFSWVFLIISAYLIIVGAFLIIKKGNPSTSRVDSKLFSLRKQQGLWIPGFTNTSGTRYTAH